MKKNFLQLALTGLIVSAQPTLANEDLSVPASGIHTLEIDNQDGNIRIEGAQINTIQVTLNKIEYKNCELITDRKEGRFVVTSKSKNKIFGRETCKLDITVKAPKQIDLDVKLGGGDVSVTTIQGKFSFKVGGGDVLLTDAEISHLDLKSGAGNVSVTGYIGSGELKVGAGNIDLSYNKNPLEGVLDLKVGSGTTTISVPNSAKISSKFKSGTGSLTNELKDSPDAKFKISGTSGTGDMVIKKI
jgi:DUF4097 and DUF4098 domain-containing protein YvlB